MELAPPIVSARTPDGADVVTQGIADHHCRSAATISGCVARQIAMNLCLAPSGEKQRRLEPRYDPQWKCAMRCEVRADSDRVTVRVPDWPAARNRLRLRSG